MTYVGSRKTATATSASVRADMNRVRTAARDKGRRKKLDKKVFDSVEAPELNWKAKR
jgi:hypothetical protein